MTKRKNTTAGERQRMLEQQIQALTTTNNIFRQICQQNSNRIVSMERRFDELSGRQRDLQYRLLAYQKLTSLDTEEINRKSEELQVADFDEFSAKDDNENGYAVIDTVDEDSIVIFTTECADGKSILRSKQAMEDIAFPDMRGDLLGKKVGDVIDVDLNGAAHKLTLLGVRKDTKKEEEANEQAGEVLQEVQSNER